MASLQANPTNIIVIGNGFDLNLGFKTSYSDFLKSGAFDDLIQDRNPIAESLQKTEQLQNWVDVERELAGISRGLGPSISVVKFEQFFTDLSHALVEYLKLESSQRINQNNHAFQLLRSLYQSDIVTARAKSNTVIFDFNYTGMASKILAELGCSQEMIDWTHHSIHGSIQQNQIVFGVEDEASIHKNDADGGHVFLRKAYNPIASKLSIAEYLRLASTVHIFGHSLGVTDQMYFNELIRGSSSTKIHLYFYGEQGRRLLWAQLDRISMGQLSVLRQRINEIDVSKPFVR